MILPTLKLIGPQKVLFPKLKIRVLVDHVGLLLLLLLVNQWLYLRKKQLICLNNSLLIVLLPMEIMDVMEDLELKH